MTERLTIKDVQEQVESLAVRHSKQSERCYDLDRRLDSVVAKLGVPVAPEPLPQVHVRRHMGEWQAAEQAQGGDVYWSAYEVARALTKRGLKKKLAKYYAQPAYTAVCECPF